MCFLHIGGRNLNEKLLVWSVNVCVSLLSKASLPPLQTPYKSQILSIAQAQAIRLLCGRLTVHDARI